VRSSVHVDGVEPAAAVETTDAVEMARRSGESPTESVKRASRRFGMAPLNGKQKTPDYTLRGCG
jgi:hypothetical protein